MHKLRSFCHQLFCFVCSQADRNLGWFTSNVTNKTILVVFVEYCSKIHHIYFVFVDDADLQVVSNLITRVTFLITLNHILVFAEHDNLSISVHINHNLMFSEKTVLSHKYLDVSQEPERACWLRPYHRQCTYVSLPL